MDEYINKEQILKYLADNNIRVDYLYGFIQSQTADVEEVRHGHWIWLEGNLYECSECPAKTEVDEKMNEPLYQFCPYCGARMDGKKVTG